MIPEGGNIMKDMNFFDWIVFILVFVGALNWGLIGFFGFNLVAFIFGEASVIAKIVYDLVGLAALYYAYTVFKR